MAILAWQMGPILRDVIYDGPFWNWKLRHTSYFELMQILVTYPNFFQSLFFHSTEPEFSLKAFKLTFLRFMHRAGIFSSSFCEST